MIRSATASSTRCREVFPSAGFPPLGLGPWSRARWPGGCDRHGEFFSFGKCIEWSGASQAAFWGERSRRRTPARALRAAMRPLSGVSGQYIYGLGQWSASMPFWGDCGDCGDCGGSLGAGRPPGLSERQCGPFPGFQDNISTVWGNGALLCPSGGIVGIAGGVSAQDARQGSQSGNVAPFRGFRTIFHGLGQWGASMPFWGDCGYCVGSRGGCGVEEGCRVVPAGEFPELRRGVCLAKPAALGRPGGGIGGRDGGDGGDGPPFSTGFGDPLSPRASQSFPSGVMFGRWLRS